MYFTFATQNKYYRKKFKEYIYITKIVQFTGQEKLQKKNNSNLNVILSDLTFVIGKVVTKPSRS